ncbi:15-hydroxyprostaglandin dehydrogenase [NAD(+)]-like isoform X2 [Glandiceps talaboti]
MIAEFERVGGKVSSTKLECVLDGTLIFDEDSEPGNLVLDLMTSSVHFRKTAPPQLISSILDFLSKAKFTYHKNGKELEQIISHLEFDDDEGSVIIMDYTDKIALITGGAEGIGRGIAEALLDRGIRGVCIVDINEKLGRVTVQQLQSTSDQQRALFIACDVTSHEELKGAFQRTFNHFGRLDIVCNNAGIINEGQWEHMLQINLNAVIRGTYLAIDYMGTQSGGNGGVIVNLSSTNGLKPNKLLPTYVASKHGVVGFSRSVADEPRVVENDVRVVTICPIMVMTSMERNVAFTGTNYKEQMLKSKAERTNRPEASVSDVAGVVLKCIEDKLTNGKVYLTLPGGGMTKIEFPNVDEILRKAITEQSKGTHSL